MTVPALWTAITAGNTKMTEFETTPIVGREVTAEEGPINNAMEEIAELSEIEPKSYITITQNDVDWDGPKKMKVQAETFEEMIEWYQSDE